MKSGIKAAIVEGIAATVLIWIFARQFCGLFGITGGEALDPSIAALRIVSLGFVFCSLVSLTTSYFMLIDRIGLATCIACFQNGLLYILLPILGSILFGFYGIWGGFAAAPMLTLAAAMLFIYLRFGRDNFPFLLNNMQTDIIVMDDTLSAGIVAELSENVGRCLEEHQYAKADANRAALFVEEIILTLIEKNKDAKKPVLVEISLFFEQDSVLIIERDSGELFDLTDPDLQIRGLSGFVLSGLMEANKEKAYLVTTGYNRNMIRFQHS